MTTPRPDRAMPLNDDTIRAAREAAANANGEEPSDLHVWVAELLYAVDWSNLTPGQQWKVREVAWIIGQVRDGR